MNNPNHHTEHYDVIFIVPFYNASSTIKATLIALINQTLPSIEIICVNDGSTDNSPTIVAELAKKTSIPLKLINQENQGVYFARINGLKHANGRYIGFCDADDLPEPNMYNKMYSQAIKNKTDLVICAYWRESAGNTFSTEMAHETGLVHHIDENSGWLASINTAVWNKLIRRRVAMQYLQIKTSPKITEDALFLLSIYPNVSSIDFVTTPLYHYQTDFSTAMTHISLKDALSIIDSWIELRNDLSHSFSRYVAIYDLAAFIHLGISIPLLLESEDSHTYLSSIRSILNKHFPLHQNNPFLRLSYVLRHIRFMKLPKIAYLCYSSHILPLLLKLYVWLNKRFGFVKKW